MRSRVAVPTASLANLASGTTFAAKARAAELHAVRSRRSSTVPEGEVPPVEPVTVGSVKFIAPRSKGVKAWKPLNLDDLPERGSKEDDVIANPNPNPILSATGQPVPMSHPVDKEHQPPGDKRALNYDHSAAAVNFTQLHHATSIDHHHQYPQSGQSTGPSVLQPYPSEWDLGMPVFNQSSVPSAMHPAESRGHRAGNQPGFQFNSRPSTAQSHMPPSVNTANMYKPTLKHASNDDPFTEQPKVNTQPSTITKFVSKPPGLHPSMAAGHKQPAAVKGTMDHDFRFPHPTQPIMNPQASYKFGQPSSAPKVPVPTVATVAASKQDTKPSTSGTYARDPKPYTSFSLASKKEMLLQNLEQVVESSKAKGDLPNATRTVLYDPFASDTPSQSRASYPSAYGKFTEPGKESLEVSEPLEPLHSPSEVFNSPPAYTLEEAHAPQFPPGLLPGNDYIYSLAQQPKPAARSLDEVEAWWRNDTRAQGIPRAALNELADARFAKDPPGYRDTPDRAGSMATPTSTRTGSSIAPIGSERLAKANNDKENNELAEMMKQVCINLESYVVPSEKSQNDYFGRFAPVPEWCIDKSPNGNDSFFGDWGVPPSRVGRDPRYRPTFHEGRYTVFEELDRRGARDGGLGRRYH